MRLEDEKATRNLPDNPPKLIDGDIKSSTYAKLPDNIHCSPHCHDKEVTADLVKITKTGLFKNKEISSQQQKLPARQRS